MLVVATQLGYFNNKRIYPGESFKLRDEKQFSEKWMKKVVKAEVEEESFEDGTHKKQRKSGKMKKHPTDVFASEARSEEDESEDVI